MQLAQGWTVNVDRGPDWLFVDLNCDEEAAAEPTGLAENLWELLQCHLGHRMVVELHSVPEVSDQLLEQLVMLSKRIDGARGMLRLCGVSASGEESIRAARLDQMFPCYADRTAAVMGNRPRQPR